MNKTLLLLAVLGFTLAFGCKPDADLSPAERYAKELAAAKTADGSIDDFYLGLELGIARQEFYDRCTELNKKQLITMGGGGNNVEHQLKDELPRPAVMSFAPDFSEDRSTVEAYTVLLSYVDWSPWNKDSHAEQLLKDLYPVLIEEYGDGFYAVPNERVGSVLVQIKGSRRIAAWVKDERYVQVRFADMRVRGAEELAYRTEAY